MILDADVAKDMANTLRQVSKAIETMLSAGLKREAIIVLVQSRTGYPKKEIDAILTSLQELESDWCT